MTTPAFPTFAIQCRVRYRFDRVLVGIHATSEAEAIARYNAKCDEADRGQTQDLPLELHAWDTPGQRRPRIVPVGRTSA